MFRKHPTFYKQMLTMMADLMPKHMTVRISDYTLNIVVKCFSTDNRFIGSTRAFRSV